MRRDTLTTLATGVVAGIVIPDPYIWYLIAVLALVVIFRVVQMVVVLVRTDAYD